MPCPQMQKWRNRWISMRGSDMCVKDRGIPGRLAVVDQKGKELSYKVKVIMEGDFPGSPDIDTWIIDQGLYDNLIDMLADQRRLGHCYRAGYDTLERKSRE